MEDAAKVRIGSEDAVQTIDFITALVPDPADFGRIAAANALSDIYVVGAWPICAMAIACVPTGPAVAEFAIALSAARDFLAENGCALIGGHSVVDDEAKLGFAITGKPNATGRLLGSGAEVGDQILLTKPLGVGVIASAYKVGAATDAVMAIAVSSMTKTNGLVPRLVESELGGAIHAATDVTGFGLLGHCFELCRRSSVGVSLRLDHIPVLPGARDFARSGICTSAFAGNAAYAAPACDFEIAGLAEADQIVLTDPQTSGGALIAIARESAEEVIALLALSGVVAALIGEVIAAPRIRLA